MWVEDLLCFVRCMCKWCVGPSTCQERLGVSQHWEVGARWVQQAADRSLFPFH